MSLHAQGVNPILDRQRIMGSWYEYVEDSLDNSTNVFDSAFLVHRNSVNQTLTEMPYYDDVNFTTATFDALSEFNLASDIFEPTEAGIYLLYASVAFSGVVAGTEVSLVLHQGGTLLLGNARKWDACTTYVETISVTGMLSLTAGQPIGVKVAVASGTPTLLGTPETTVFLGKRVG